MNVWGCHCGCSTEEGGRRLKNQSRKAGPEPSGLAVQCYSNYVFATCQGLTLLWNTIKISYQKIEIKRHTKYEPKCFTTSFNTYKIILPVTIKVSKCLTSIWVPSHGLTITNSSHTSSWAHALSSTVDRKPSNGSKHRCSKFRVVFFKDHSGCWMENEFGVGGAIGAIGDVLVRDHVS